MKKLTGLLLILCVFLLSVQPTFAAKKDEEIASEKVRIPFQIALSEQGQRALATDATVIGGYVDFWVTTKSVGRIVTPHYEVAIDTPSNAFITGFAFNVYFSGNEFNGGDVNVPIARCCLAHESYSGTGNKVIYTQAGSYSATITGTVSTNLGVAMTVSPNKTVYFKFTV